ncbi:MAG: glycosyltransferase family 4 protein [Pseudomonadota bacterium]
MKKSVLIMSGNFPPFCSAGVFRIVKMVKYLAELGWECHVLPLNYSTKQDQSLLHDVPPNATIHTFKIAVIKPQNRVNIFCKKILGLFQGQFFPDRYIFKMLSLLPEGRRILATQKIDFIFASSPPYSVLIGGLILSKMTGAKFIVDFRDPWADNPHLNWGKIKRGCQRFFESYVVKKADIVIANTDELADRFRKKYKTARIVIINNGYDPDDYKDLITNEEKSSVLTIIHTGKFYPEIRNPHSLLVAVGELVATGKVEPGMLKLIFIGGGELVDEEDFKSLITEYSLSEIVKTRGHLPHQEAIAEMAKTDVLLLMQNSPEASMQIPGKAFEYLFFKKPILSLSPPGATSNLIYETDSGLVVNPDDVFAIKEAILHLIALKMDGKLISNFQYKNIEQYNRKVQAEQLEKLFFQA